MNVCPKCRHEGEDDEQCEKCGIIFDRMHTVVELRPLGALGEALAARGAKAAQPFDPASVPDTPLPPPPVAAKVSTAPVPPARPAVPVVPKIARAPEQPKRIRGWIVVLGVVALSIALMSELLDRREAARMADEASERAAAEQYDAPYFGLAVEALLTDCRRDLRRVEDPAAGEAARVRLSARVAHLTRQLKESPLSPDVRAPYAEALAAVSEFLGDSVPAAIAAARELGARAEPTPTQALERAAAALSRAAP